MNEDTRFTNHPHVGNGEATAVDIATLDIQSLSPGFVPMDGRIIQDMPELAPLPPIPDVVDNWWDSLELPTEFPTENEVYNVLIDATRAFVGNNVLRPMVGILTPFLGDNADIFNDSIMYKCVGIDGSLYMFQGRVPVQQVIGKVLNDDSVMAAFQGPQINSFAGSNSTSDTRVKYNSDQRRIEVHHTIPDNRLARRYLSHTAVDVEVDDGLMDIMWIIPCDENNMSGLMSVANQLQSALTIYYKLLTRFPSCQSYQNALPSFQNS